MPDSSSAAPQSVPSSAATPSAPMVWPALRYVDAPAAIDFLTTVVGFEATVVYASEDDPSVVDHAELRWPLGGGIMLGSHRESTEWPASVGHGACYIVTDQPDRLFARVSAAGATVVRSLNDTDYGSREFAIRDPEGNLWSFGTYAGQ